MNFVVGLDPSLSGTAIVALREDGSSESKRCSSKPQGTTAAERVKRFRELTDEVVQSIGPVMPKLVLIEGYSFASKGSSGVTLAEYGGILRYRLIQAGCTVREVPPSTLKKFVTGAGNADKTAMVAQLTKRYGVTLKTEDEYDAYGLAKMAACIVGWEPVANIAQREALGKVA